MATDFNKGASNSGGSGAKLGPIIKWVVILIVAVIAAVLLWMLFVRDEGNGELRDHTLTYVDDNGRVQPVCYLSASTAYAIRGWDATRASDIKYSKCKRMVKDQCKTLPFGNPRTVCNRELTSCICSK